MKPLQLFFLRSIQIIGFGIALVQLYYVLLGDRASSVDSWNGALLPTIISMFFTLVFPVAFPTLFALFATFQIRTLQHYATHTYERYVQDNPQCAGPRGVTCFKCQSPRIHTKNLMQRTYTREHHCGQCGTTLYYSSEQNR